MADKDDLTPQNDPTTPETDGADLAGEYLAEEDLGDPGAYELAADETEAEELAEGDLDSDEAVADPEQLSEAELVAATARDTRPVRKAPAAVAPVKKGRATPKRSTKPSTQERTWTSPVQFVRESAAELRKVVWPTASQLRQYFIVVLVFVLMSVTP